MLLASKTGLEEVSFDRLISGKCPKLKKALLLNLAYYKAKSLLFLIVILTNQFSHSVISDSLQLCLTHGLQQTRLPCPSPTPRACSNSGPLSRWYYLTISSSVVPFSRLQSLPASGSFPISQFFASGGQSIGASASVLPMNIQDWFPSGWTGLISLLSKGHWRVLQHHCSKSSVLWHSSFFMVQLSHPYMTTGKTIALTRRTFVSKVMSLLFNCLGWSWLFFQGASVF